MGLVTRQNKKKGFPPKLPFPFGGEWRRYNKSCQIFNDYQLAKASIVSGLYHLKNTNNFSLWKLTLWRQLTPWQICETCSVCTEVFKQLLPDMVPVHPPQVAPEVTEDSSHSDRYFFPWIFLLVKSTARGCLARWKRWSLRKQV